ncbi:hypothetical protein MKW92_000134 [Papaver armeniacum]|nr:hypothetical protein MKW92_000134 [Papaver armeniacum]
MMSDQLDQEAGSKNGGHILIVPYPSQGHINPMLQFSKRLISKGLRITLAITVHVSKTMGTKINGPIAIETISDGFDDGGSKEAGGPSVYVQRFKIVGSETLTQLIEKLQTSGNPVSCVVYDPFIPWVLDVTKEFGLIGAAFFTQSCIVGAIYYCVQKGLVKAPVPADQAFSVPGLPPLGASDLPSFVAGVGPYPFLLDYLANQFANIHKADWVLFSTFDKLESEVLNWMAKSWQVRGIGPTLPSMYLEKGIEDDKDYGFHIFVPKRAECINWLNTKKSSSVIYVSFGSISIVKQQQIEEIAMALLECKHNFLWVVREAEECKIPSKFLEEATPEKGLIIRWCPQLEVLSHPAVGCFVTHCGFNSTLEGLSLGVPMIALPQWTDQPMNAKCIEDLWGVGMRPKADEEGIFRKKEIELCIRFQYQGLINQKTVKENASKWKELAKEAVDEGGSSDRNIKEFVAQVMSFATH